jgi:hypothetical protein
MVIFHSYVSLPEGSMTNIISPGGSWWKKRGAPFKGAVGGSLAVFDLGRFCNFSICNPKKEIS